jgi:hypothetical protein
MGIYVGCLPAHTYTVGFILNPHTGHMLPQVHVAYINNFTIVLYLRTVKVPPSDQFSVASNKVDI